MGVTPTTQLSPGTSYALRGEIADAIREYCHSVSPAAVQMSHGVERIYYAGISLDGLTDAIFAALGAGFAQAQREPHETTYLRGWNEGTERALEIVGNMRQSEAGLFDAKHSGQRGEDRSNALYDAYVAIRASLVPSTLHSPSAATIGDIPSEPRPPASAAMGLSAGGEANFDPSEWEKIVEDREALVSSKLRGAE